MNLTGGVVYDAVIARTARLTGATHVLTLNVSDFERVFRNGSETVVSPLLHDPPHTP